MFDSIISACKLAVQAWGAWQAVMGLINLGEGNSQQSAAKKDEGFNKIVGGVIIFVVGTFVVPQISQFLSL